MQILNDLFPKTDFTTPEAKNAIWLYSVLIMLLGFATTMATETDQSGLIACILWIAIATAAFISAADHGRLTFPRICIYSALIAGISAGLCVLSIKIDGHTYLIQYLNPLILICIVNIKMGIIHFIYQIIGQRLKKKDKD